jgi:L-alanine-DL-glutamate epimerase-like enolase superfamily enzyme
VYGIADLIEVIRRHAADMVNVKLAKCGGLAVGRTLLELATSAGLETIVGSMMESPVGVGAAASLAAAYGTSATSDLDAAWWLERRGAGGITYEQGEVTLPNRPGLGIESIDDLHGQ